MVDCQIQNWSDKVLYCVINVFGCLVFSAKITYHDCHLSFNGKEKRYQPLNYADWYYKYQVIKDKIALFIYCQRTIKTPVFQSLTFDLIRSTACLINRQFFLALYFSCFRHLSPWQQFPHQSFSEIIFE